MSYDWTQDANCQAAWLFAEGSGTTVEDSSANTNTGNFKGSGEPAWSTDVPAAYTDYSVAFDGTNDYISCGDDSSIDISTNLSVLTWAKSDDISLIEKALISHGQEHWYVRFDSSKIQVIDSRRALVLTSTTSLSDDTWYHVAFTVDNSSPKNVIIYKDGVNDGSTTYSGSFNGSYGVYFGADSGPSIAEFFNGYISESSIFNTVLDATDINDIMDNGLKQEAAPTESTTAFMTCMKGYW